MEALVGAFGTSPTLRTKVDLMLRSLPAAGARSIHRYDDDHLGCHLGWSASLVGSIAPIWDASRKIGLVFIGEVFSHGSDAMSQTLAQGGADLIERYRLEGLTFLGRLSGTFNGVLIDTEKSVAFLFNDRFGLARVYCRHTEDGFFFASEAKALLRIFRDSRSLDATAVAEVISVGCVMQGRTLFQLIEALPPSTVVTFGRASELSRDQYFTPKQLEEQQPLGESDFQDTLRDTFSRLVPNYLTGPAAVGMSLTGGLDGRMLMAWCGAKPGALPCYSFSGPYRESHDVRIAREVAAQCSQPHQIIAVGSEFISLFPELASRTVRVSDGTMDVSGAVELYVNERARTIAPVRLTGNYGSEIMRGNVAFRPRQRAEGLFEEEVALNVARAEATYRDERRGHDLSFIAFKQVPWHHHARWSVERSQLLLRSPFLDGELLSLMYRAPRPLSTMGDVILRLIHDGNPRIARVPTDRGVAFGAPTVLNHMRRFMREFSAKAEYSCDYGMPQWFARATERLRALQIERAFLGRHKFYHFRTWYRHALSGFVRDVLLTPRAEERSLFRPGVLRRMVESHTTGRGNYTLEIHLALTFELIRRELLDGAP